MLSLNQSAELAWIWFHDRLDPTWRRKTLDETESIFAGLGLKGSFWRLRP
jgi:hypothetical protein